MKEARRAPTPVEERELEFTCRFCNKQPNEWCTTKGGRRSQVLHADRYHQARAAGRLPLRWRA